MRALVHLYVCARGFVYVCLYVSVDEATAPVFFVWEQARMPRASVDPAGICWAVVVRQVKDNIYPACICICICVCEREVLHVFVFLCVGVCLSTGGLGQG